MTKFDRTNSRVTAPDTSARIERLATQQAFERELRLSLDEHRDREQAGSGPSAPDRLMQDLMGSLQRSLMAACSPSLATEMADKLAASIRHAVQSARVTRTERWHLVMRLPEELVSLSEIDVACQPGHVRIALRTSSAESYEILLAARPELERSMRQRQLFAEPVQIVLVNRLDLS